jgi:RNA 3'-terminal phosphate cyclase (ATP)
MGGMLRIDGSMGEGGGQVVRSSLSLAALTGTPIRVENIRAGRRKPGLLRQHLTALTGAAVVCDAEVEGASLGSRAITFTPGPVRGGSHSFAVGTAGSATLVCQTVLPILLGASVASELTFEGGTHNPMAPPFDFFDQLFLPLLRRMGFSVHAELGRAGFYPAGGGRFSVTTEPAAALTPLELLQSVASPRVQACIVQARLPAHVAQRERDVILEALELAPEAVSVRKVRSPGPGNAVVAWVSDGDDVVELCTAFGERGRPAEIVAQDVVDQVRAYLAADPPVGEHLADQLLLPLVLGGGAFRTGPLSSHTRTNIEVIRMFLGESAIVVEEAGDDRCVRAPAGGLADGYG